MNNLIERYVYDVVRRLPEQERGDVGDELRSNIYDMLPDGATEDDISAALTGLGAPAILAEQYRINPRSLISPALFESYIRAVKWVVPLVGCIVLVIGLLQGGAEATKAGITESPLFIRDVIISGISAGISGAINTLLGITIGFAIADRARKKTSCADKWSINDLPCDIPPSKKVIPLSDSIVELIIIAIITIVGVNYCLGRIPIPIMLNSENIQLYHLFSDSFLLACIPVIIIGGLLGICESVAKIIKRRWTPLVCGTIIVSNLTCIVLLLYLCARQDIFSSDFLSLVQSQGWQWSTDAPVWGNPIVVLIVTIVIVASLIECIVAIYRTTRFNKVA